MHHFIHEWVNKSSNRGELEQIFIMHTSGWAIWAILHGLRYACECKMDQIQALDKSHMF